MSPGSPCHICAFSWCVGDNKITPGQTFRHDGIWIQGSVLRLGDELRFGSWVTADLRYGAPGLNTATFVQRRNCWRKNLKKFRHIYNPKRGLGRKQTDEFGVLEHFQPFLVKSSPKYTVWTLSPYVHIRKSVESAAVKINNLASFEPIVISSGHFVQTIKRSTLFRGIRNPAKFGHIILLVQK